MPERKADTLIIGGGISGAALLHWLGRAGHDVLLLERNDHIGGVVRTERTPLGALAEFGPNTVQLNPALNRLIDDLGLQDGLVLADPAAKNRYVLRDGRLLPIPTSPKAIWRSALLSRTGKLRALREIFVAKKTDDSEETVAGFVQRRLGSEALDYLVNPFISGVYAGDPADLSVRYAMKRLYDLEQNHGGLLKGALAALRARRRARKALGNTPPERSGLFSFRTGLAALPGAIADLWNHRIVPNAHVNELRRHGERWIAQTKDEVYTARNVVVATEAYSAARLFIPIDAPLANMLRRVYYPPVALCFSVYRRQDVGHPLDGFGMLLPQVEGRRILGTIFVSTLFPDRVPEGYVSLATFAGGVRGVNLAMGSPESIARTVSAELSELLNITQAPAETHVRTWRSAIPQYRMGHGMLLGELDRAEKEYPGLYLLGNYRGGVSLGDCVTCAQELAGRLMIDD